MRFSLKLAQSTQPGERHSKFSTERQKFWSRVTFWGKTPPKGISRQNTLLNNFLPVQPILTCKYTNGFSSTSGNPGIHPKFLEPLFRVTIREFPKKFPLNNFSTVQPIFTSNILIDSAKQGKQNEVIKVFKIPVYGSKGAIFVKKIPS
jgi:hypothetical protein